VTILVRVFGAWVLPVAWVVSVAFLVRGYSGGGDGFSAGVVAALGALAQYVCAGSGNGRRRAVTRHAPKIALSGLALTGATALWPVAIGLPPLTHFPRASEPVVKLGTLELHTAVLFDLGILFLVYGMIVSAIDRLLLGELE
jgi:multisubunit Na+/H+ antiporter MnhB subunit